VCVPDEADQEVIQVGVSSVAVQYFQANSNGNLIRTWVATDLAGNPASHVQTIYVSDTTDPVLSRMPADETVECDCESFPKAPLIEPLDNCDDTITVDFTEDLVTGKSDNDYTLVRTWFAADVSGNSVSHTQTITVEDTTPPQLGVVPKKTDFKQCNKVPTAPANFARDACDENAKVTFTETVVPADHCSVQQTITREWVALDASGNSATVSQTLNVVDSTAPTPENPVDYALYPANGEYVKISVDTLFDPVDNCSPAQDLSVNIFACNTTATEPKANFASGCFMESDNTLWARADPAVTRYDVFANVVDECGNTKWYKHVVRVAAREDDVRPGATVLAPSLADPR